MVPHEPVSPSDNHTAVVFEFNRYRTGWMQCELQVDDDFKFADLQLKWRSLDYSSEFLRDWTYLEEKTAVDEAESELVGLIYRGCEYEFGYDVSFSGNNSELQYFSRDEDGELVWQIYTSIFDSDEFDEEMSLD